MLTELFGTHVIGTTVLIVYVRSFNIYSSNHLCENTLNKKEKGIYFLAFLRSKWEDFWQKAAFLCVCVYVSVSGEGVCVNVHMYM